MNSSSTNLGLSRLPAAYRSVKMYTLLSRSFKTLEKRSRDSVWDQLYRRATVSGKMNNAVKTNSKETTFLRKMRNSIFKTKCTQFPATYLKPSASPKQGVAPAQRRSKPSEPQRK